MTNGAGRPGARPAEADLDAAAAAGIGGSGDPRAGAGGLRAVATCAVVPAAGVIGEAMVAIVLAQAFLEKFGGDSLAETRRNYDGYLEQVKNF